MPASTKHPRRSHPSSSKATGNLAPKCYLTTIPSEVRDLILRHLLVLPEDQRRPIYYRADDLRNKRHPDMLGDATFKALTLTCKVLYFESISLFYRHNLYIFDSWNSLCEILSSIGPGRRQHIRDVTVTPKTICYGKDHMKRPKVAATLLQQCNVKKLTLFVDPISAYYALDEMLSAAGMKKLREIRGLKEFHVKISEAPSWWGPDEPRVLKENVRHFEAVLKNELCQEKVQASTNPTGITGELKK